MKINKVIDPLHISNHKVANTLIISCIEPFFQRPTCKTLYSPDKVAEEWPEANLMICEETFAWLGKEKITFFNPTWLIILGRFKKTLNLMPKNHFHFFLHRLIIRRNRYGIFKVGTCTVLYFYRYTEYCHCVGKYPLLPSAKVRKLPTTPSDAVVSPTPGPASTPTDAVALSTLGPASTPTDVVALATLGQASTPTDMVTLSTLGRATCPTDAVALSTGSSNHPN